MTAPRIVVGIEKHGADYRDAFGCWWAWDKAARLWRHDRTRCQLNDGGDDPKFPTVDSVECVR